MTNDPVNESTSVSLNFEPIKQATNDQIREFIFAKRPLLAQLAASQNEVSLKNYAANILKHELNQPNQTRQAEFIHTFKQLVAQRLGTAIAEAATTQLQKYYFVSTADHHGPVCSSFSLSSNLIAATGMAEIKDPELKYLIVLSCASISLNNEDFPRGLIFHSNNTNLDLQRLSFLPSNSHSCLVYNFRPYTEAEVTKVKKLLNEKIREHAVTQEYGTKITQLLDTIYAQPEALNAPNYCDQITKTNFHLWKNFLPNQSDQPPVPDLIYIEQEKVVAALLAQHHIENTETILHKMLFSNDASIIIQPLQQAMDQFSRQGVQGTDLFWGVDPVKHYRLGLHREGNELVSHDGSFKIALEPKAIQDALKNHTIVPNLLVIFTTLVLYYHLNCSGGFNQMHYLEAMQQAYNNLNQDPIASTANPSIFDYGLRSATLKNSAQNQTLATGIDMILFGSNQNWANMLKDFNDITFAQALDPSLPEYYQLLGGNEDQQ